MGLVGIVSTLIVTNALKIISFVQNVMNNMVCIHKTMIWFHVSNVRMKLSIVKAVPKTILIVFNARTINVSIMGYVLIVIRIILAENKKILNVFGVQIITILKMKHVKNVLSIVYTVNHK